MGKFSFDEGQHIVISFYSEWFSYYNLGYNPHVSYQLEVGYIRDLPNFQS